MNSDEELVTLIKDQARKYIVCDIKLEIHNTYKKNCFLL